MQYYKMICKQPAKQEAIVINDTSYTYGDLQTLASERAKELLPEDCKSANTDTRISVERAECNTVPESITAPEDSKNTDIQKIHVIKKEHIIEQLTDFLACNAIGIIPLIMPNDCKITREEVSLLAQKELEKIYNQAEHKKVCMAVMTSGTTGIPKIYFRTYESWAGFFDVQNEIFQVTGQSRLFTQGSLAFTGNLNLYLAQFYAGGTIIAQEAFWPKDWKRAICKYHANAIYLIPSKLMLLPKVQKEPNREIRMILSGSQSLGTEDAKLLEVIYPDTQLILYYGASELNYITYVTGKQMNGKRNLIGKAFPTVSVKLKEDEFYIDTAYHVEGVTMPCTLHDTGYCDQDGSFYFTGRKDDILNIRGRKISALKIENAFLQIDEVKEIAVKAGLYHKEAVIEAYIEAGEDFLERYRQKWHNELKKELEAYEIPHRIFIRKQLPKNDSGKIIKERLHPDDNNE